MHCKHCGGSLASFEGETYCPDCCRLKAEEQARQADDEARRLRLAPAPPPTRGRPATGRPSDPAAAA
jgi:uncharacterized Zn finger protein (UPF0148 family)